jgi:excisionase family DNA binding protein
MDDPLTGLESPLLLTVENAARSLQISRTSLYAALARGDVKAIKLGRSTRIHRSELERIAREGIE